MTRTVTYIPRNQVRRLARRSDIWGAWVTLHCWGVILGSMALYVLFPNPIVFAISFLLIGSRQHGLAILMHDAAHRVLFQSKRLNELVGRYILGAPYGGDLHAYRRYHLQHHRHTQTERDPDLPLSAKFPTTKASLRRKFFRDMTGQTFVRLRIASWKMKRGGANFDGSEAFQSSSPWPTVLTNALLFGGLYAAGHPWLYLTLWILPLATWFMVVIRLRNIAEHGMTSVDDNPLTHARTTRANLLERVLFAPYWVNYHVEHHAYMFVPCYRLKSLHKEMMAAGHGPAMETKPNYGAVLRAAAPA